MNIDQRVVTTSSLLEPPNNICAIIITLLLIDTLIPTLNEEKKLIRLSDRRQLISSI